MKKGLGWVVMFSKVVRLVDIFNFGDKGEMIFPTLKELYWENLKKSEKISFFTTFNQFLAMKEGWGWVGMFCKVICLVEIFNFVDKSEVIFSTPNEICRKDYYFTTRRAQINDHISGTVRPILLKFELDLCFMIIYNLWKF